MNDYAFEYDFEGETCILLIGAWTEAEALRRVAAIRYDCRYTQKIAIPATPLGLWAEATRRFRLWMGW